MTGKQEIFRKGELALCQCGGGPELCVIESVTPGSCWALVCRSSDSLATSVPAESLRKIKNAGLVTSMRVGGRDTKFHNGMALRPDAPDIRISVLAMGRSLGNGRVLAAAAAKWDAGPYGVKTWLAEKSWPDGQWGANFVDAVMSRALDLGQPAEIKAAICLSSYPRDILTTTGCGLTVKSCRDSEKLLGEDAVELYRAAFLALNSRTENAE